ncbi:MAG: PD40 domain-containing protein [Bacteroidaceae bacterium]|nr:PD40 domain-containing protein [Bacteroidaceae bacterium]
MNKSLHASLFTLLLVLTACNRVSIPTEYTQVDSLPKIYPDYVDVTIPVNIAPLTFMLDIHADDMVARYSVPDGSTSEIAFSSSATPSLSDWHQLLAAAQGKDLQVEVYARRGDRWTRYQPFAIHVSPDSIDPYISYRLISPSFVAYEVLTINQRCLENYDESVIYDNFLCSENSQGQCINCHNYQQYNPERMQFHARQKDGGTIIAYDGTLKRVNMRNDSILSAGVYPAWHPWLPFIVYSTDKTTQSFHTTDPNKIEVYDSESDLITYNIETDEVCNLENDTTEYEVFPCWAPDGKMLYYCSAHLEPLPLEGGVGEGLVSKEVETLRRVEELKYNIYRKPFNPETYEFGPSELVFDAAALDKSAVLPRVSPDGRFLLFTVGTFGYFHIWHHDADLWMIDLTAQSETSPAPSQGGESQAVSQSSPLGGFCPPMTGEPKGVQRPLNKRGVPMQMLNSPDTESYHSWSSNGRWVIFSSRRDDGTFTRPFIAHIDQDGNASRPFELPMARPDAHRLSMKSYNIPEFMHGPVTIAPQTFADILKGEAVDVKYAGHK